MTFDEFKEVRDRIIDEYGYNINCFTFYTELKKVYPEARAWYNHDHILTQIGSCLYDKDGCKMFDFEATEPLRYAEAMKHRTVNSAKTLTN